MPVLEVYLDNSATTKPCPESRKRLLEAAEVLWGNPSSLHQKGLEAQMLLEDARAFISKITS